ncbi:MAG: DNA mismatch repair endonuclease MutL [Planctomycetota bacterium]
MQADPQPSIRVLPEAVASRIAAGEVVERPASVVKELAENALDAGTRSIHVELAAGGRELVRVSDDGRGMGPEDLALCVLPHATSKLQNIEDLEQLSTLGFRGEALPSIAAISRFTLTSRRRSGRAEADASAWRIEIAGGEPERPEPRPAAAAEGTTVEVRDLFFNVPARAKFLKGPGPEAAACADALLRLALTRPDVAFTLIQGRQEVFALLAAHNPADGPPPLGAFLRRARDVLGRSASEGLLELDVAGPGDSATAPAADLSPDYRGYKLYGLISPPALTRPNRSSIHLAVNGRPVKDRLLTSALLESCRHLLPPQRYPVAVLFLDLPGADVDINVHPTKAEVRFRLPGLVYALFHHAIRVACGAVSPDSRALPATPPPFQPSTPPAPAQREFHLWPQPARAEPSAEPPPAAPPAQYSTPGALKGKVDRVAEEAVVFAEPVTLGTQTSTLKPQASALSTQYSVLSFRILGQAGGAYIALEDESGVKLIDQHALHERILFEELMARAEGRARGDAQGLLLAEPLELTPAQAAVFADESATEVLKQLGFEVEPFGPRSLLVRAVPAFLKSASAPGLVLDVLDALAGSSDAPGAPSRAALREKAMKTVACKGAIKAGERLTFEQMNALVAEYRRKVGPRGYTCPHGRPVALEVSWEELERAVGRR